MRIAMAQINPTVGDLAGNCRRILEFIERAKAAAAEVVVFPELAITGYPPKDLLLKPQFVDDNLAALHRIASRVRGIEAVVGYAERNDQPAGRPLHNAVAVLRDGRVAGRHLKTLLPTYDVFDETRYFEPGPADRRNHIIPIAGAAVGLSICEDLWNDERLIARRLYHHNPIAELHAAGAELLINASASPFVVGKHDFRLELFGGQARHFGRPIVYVNQVGGNDELIFDGNSVAFDAAGNIIAHAKDFEEDLVVFDLELRSRISSLRSEDSNLKSETSDPRSETPDRNRAISAHTTGIESIYRALVLGLRDYVQKCGFFRVVVGLSGGIDSAVTAALAAAALGAENVTGVALPSRYSSDHSLADAEGLARNLGIPFHVIPINDVHEAYERTLQPAFHGLAPDLAEENLQARIRGALLMAFSNKFNQLLLTTGNKSEVAVGYCTLYGDMAGGLAVINDVPKTTIYELAQHINARAGRELIPQGSITKPPSAELRPDQTDQDSLPPYDLLDAILFRYVEEEKGAAAIIEDGFDPETVVRVIRMVDRSEYKRRQAAPGLKVTSRAFGFGRRMPIAQGYQQPLPRHGEPSPTLEELPEV